MIHRPVKRLAARLTQHWANRRLAMKGLVVIALPLAILLSALGSLYLASAAEARAENDVRRAFAIQRDTYQAHALLAEAAGGVRGYLLTRQRRFLAPYVKAERELDATFARLDRDIRDSQIRARFDRMRALAVRKRAGLDNLVQLADRQSGTAPIEQALVANKLVLDAMRAEIAEIQVREARLLDQRRARVDEVRHRFLLLTAISAVVGLAGSLAAVTLFSTGIVRRVQLLEANAGRLARGEPLVALPDDADEIGQLAQRLAGASALLRAREQALRESEERFRLVIAGVRDYGIFALDADGRVVSWNLGAERIKGWAADAILGQHFSSFYPPETRDHLPAAMLARARADGTAEDEGWRVRKDGSRFWANVVITALYDDAGRLRGFAKVTRDMTERRRAEDALRLARADAEAANIAKSEFLSRTSHELRTPMNAILGFGQLLELDAHRLTPPDRAAVEQILRAARHLLALINDLLDISSIEAGADHPEIAAIDVAEVMGAVHDLAAPLAAAAGLRLDLDLPATQPHAPLLVAADRRRVVQIALNLIANAAKYHGRGTAITISAAMVDPADGSAAVRVSVRDDGVGIAPADVPRLFVPFDRLGQSGQRRGDGTGLGLALSKRLAESMGGTIGYCPADPGACFWFALPVAAAILPTEGVADVRQSD